MRVLINIAFIMALLQVPVWSATIHVPGDQASIQQGILAASNGDTVLVAPGTYVENIDLMGKSITLISEQGPEVTVLDGNQSGGVAVFENGEGLDCILEGFKITNGSGTYTEISSGIWHYCGGGILVKDSSPTIRNNVITQNTADGGPGIYCLKASPAIINNDISYNTNTGVMGFVWGGGIDCANYSSPIIENNRITHNIAQYGGGVACYHHCSAAIRNNLISNNSAEVSGGGIYFGQSDVIISENRIYGNTADYGGGILGATSYGSNTMNNIIAGNTAIQGGGIKYVRYHTNMTNDTIFGNSAETGGGICLEDCDIIVKNMILRDNTALTGQEAYLSAYSLLHTSMTFSHSNVKGGLNYVYQSPYLTLHWDTTSMIDSDPLFIDMDGPDNNPGTWEDNDYHLSCNSPCRDTGDNGAVTEPYDFEGDPRIAYGAVDMGADEFSPHLYYLGDATPGGDIQLKFIGLPGDAVNGLILGLNIFDPPLPCDYGLWYMDNPFQILMGFGTIPAEGVKVITGTLDLMPPAPYTVYLQGVMEMRLTNLCTMNVK